MATNTANLTVSGTMTDAEFRLLCQFIADTLEAGGVIKTSDTGQADLTAITYPGGSNTAAGYEIRRFSDAMQSTKPVFIKIEYGRAGTATSLGLYITIGTGSNGSGTITGVRRTRDSYPLYLTNGTMSSAPCFISAGTNRFCFAINVTSGSAGFMSLERTIDSARVVTDQGLLFCYKTSGNSMLPATIFHSGSQPAEGQSGDGGALPPTTQSSGAHANGNIGVYPQFFFGVGETLVPSLNAVGGFATDFIGGTSYAVSLLGTTQTMIALDKAGAWGINRGGNTVAPNSSTFTMLMRYE